MFKEDVTQYCPMCEEWARKYEKLERALQEIKQIADENKDTAQYGGICKSILMIITKGGEE